MSEANDEPTRDGRSPDAPEPATPLPVPPPPPVPPAPAGPPSDAGAGVAPPPPPPPPTGPAGSVPSAPPPPGGSSPYAPPPVPPAWHAGPGQQGPYAQPSDAGTGHARGVHGQPVQPAALGASLPPWLSADVLLSALRHAGVVFGLVVVAGLVQAVLLLGIADAGLDGADVLPLGALVSALAYGGYASVSYTGSVFGVDADAHAALHFFPLAFTVLFALATAAVAAWEGRRPASRAASHAASTAAGVLLAVLLCVWTAIFSIRQDGVTVSGLSPVLVVGAVVITYLASWWGRSVARRGLTIRAVRDTLQSAWSGLRELVVVVVWGAAAYGAVALVASVAVAASEGALPALGALPLWIGNAAVAVAAVAGLGAVDATGSLPIVGSGGEMIALWHGLPAWSWIAFLVAIAFTAFIATRVGLQRDPLLLNRYESAWVHPVGALVGWLLLPLLFAGVSLGGSGGGFASGMTASGGLSVALWVAPVMLVWGAAIEAGARLLPRVALAVGPSAARAIGGRYAHPGWTGAWGPTAWNPSDAGAGHGETRPFWVPAGPAPAAPPPYGAPAPLSPRARRRILVGGGVVAVVLLVAVGGTIALNVLGSTHSPEAAVTAYATAIARGDASSANRLVDPDVPNGERALLSDDAMGGTTQRIGGIRVGDAEGTGDTRTVALSYTLDGVERETSLSLERDGKDGLFDRWRITTPLVYPVALASTLPATGTFGGQEVAVPASADDAGYWAYPGVYTLALDEGDYLTADEVEVEVGEEAVDAYDDVIHADVLARPTDALVAEVQQQVEDAITGCVAEAADDSADIDDVCPFDAYVSWSDEVRDVEWTIDDMPGIEIDSGSDGLIFYTDDYGTISATFESLDWSDEWQEDEGSDVFTVEGTIAIEDGTVSVDLTADPYSW